MTTARSIPSLRCLSVTADQLRVTLVGRRQAGSRFVDLVEVPDQDAASFVVLADAEGYELLTIDGGPMPSLHDLWSAAGWPAPSGGQRRDEDLANLIALGDAGPVTWRRLDLGVCVDGERIDAVQARRGRLHAGLARQASSHPYLQLPVLAETLNEQAPSTLGLLTTLGIEALLGIEPPIACQYARVFIAELERLSSHCGWLVSQAAATQDEGLVNEARQGRERLAQLFVQVSGRRRLMGIHLPGRILIEREGVAELLEAVAADLTRLIETAQRSLSGRRSWRRRLLGVGAVDPEWVADAALSGPTARACGVAMDGRRQQPYLTYEQLDFEVAIGTQGDIVDRCSVRLTEMRQSLSLARQALAAAQGPLAVDDPRIVPPTSPDSIAPMIHHFELWMEGHGLQPPPGKTAFVAIEGPEGELGVLLQSNGSSKPARAHWRSPSHYHFGLLSRLLMGQRLSDAGDLVASLNINAAEMDR